MNVPKLLAGAVLALLSLAPAGSSGEESPAAGPAFLSGEDDFSRMKTDPALTRLDLDESLSSVLFTGNGTHRLIFITDVFCSWCRSGYAYITAKKDAFSEVRLMQMPLRGHPGADAAAWVFEHAAAQGFPVEKLAEFAFRDLEQPDLSLPPEKIRLAVITSLHNRFPELHMGTGESFAAYLEEHYARRTEYIFQYLRRRRIDGTPVFLLDNQPVRGFNSERLNSLLSD